ncbi:MAG TPA: tRNA 2-thiouridine(34) synthase MnmA [Syntrophomonas sp.]|nr:tRNA 2-thiouridine(34) synthase MnmA [Syntrophomonas sp.]
MGPGKVMAAMSGGVDSSVAVMLLLKSGYEVAGATLDLMPCQLEDNPDRCCGWSAIDDARRVAAQLNIPHYVLNYKEKFDKQVIDYFCDEYLRGRTPNPCIVCNRRIKFGDLLKQAQSMGMNYLATGHYARIQYDPQRQRYILLRGLDKRKDQSYVLYSLTQEQLAHTLFPLGEYSKPQIRAMASELELVVAEKAESQEICFVPDDDYARFVEERFPGSTSPGPILNLQGEILGQHRGIVHYTIGQRRGLRLAQGQPIYVVALDPQRNAVIVGSNNDVFSTGCNAVDLNWIAFEKLEQALEVEAQIRYTAKPVRAMISNNHDGSVQVEFKEAVRAVTPGQAIVFYEGDTVVGGGTIN